MYGPQLVTLYSTIIIKRNKTITIWGNRGFLNYANIAKPGRL